MVLFMVFFMVSHAIMVFFMMLFMVFFMVFYGVYKHVEFSKTEYFAFEEIKSYIDPLAGIPRY